MTFIDDVQRAKSPREAMLNLAAGLDTLVERLDALEINNSWDSWGAEDGPRAPEIIEKGDETEVVIPPPTPTKMKLRRILERQQLKIGEYLNDDTEDWTEVYAKGGPTWLYIFDRDLVMSLPMSTRQALVADLEEDDPKAAAEMARDILKQSADATGPGSGLPVADEFAGGVIGISGAQ